MMDGELTAALCYIMSTLCLPVSLHAHSHHCTLTGVCYTSFVHAHSHRILTAVSSLLHPHWCTALMLLSHRFLTALTPLSDRSLTALTPLSDLPPLSHRSLTAL